MLAERDLADDVAALSVERRTGAGDRARGGRRDPLLHTTADSTIFLLAEVSDDVWITAVPAGGGATPCTSSPQVWALLPSYEGVLPLDLTTGDRGDPVDLGCPPGREVRVMTPGTDGAIVLGECDPGTQMLWFVGP